MRKTIGFGMAILFIFTLSLLTACSRTAPSLDVNLSTESTPEQRVQAIQLSTSWESFGSGFAQESAHPLEMQANDFDSATLLLDDETGEIEMSFRNNNVPSSVSVQRWHVERLNGELDVDGDGVIDEGETVEVDGNTIPVINDGVDYIYEVYAVWHQGQSVYTFRVDRVQAQ